MDGAGVRLDRKSTIFPALPSQPQHCKLCSSDVQMLCCNYIQRCLLYSMETISCDFQTVVEILKKSLSQTLVYFYSLAGRLAFSPEGVVYIDCNDDGAEFVEAVAPEIGLAQLMADDFSPVVRQLFHLSGALDMDGSVLPLLVIQATKLKDGLALGFTVNHSIIDGTSLWHFINSFAQLCRDPSSNIALPPLHTRCFGTPHPIHLNLNHHKTSKLSKSPLSQLTLREKLFHFTPQTISNLKLEANNGGTSRDPKISSFQALCAHIWLAITRARGLSPTEETTFKLPVDCRPRMVPPLPSSYFGNAVQMVGASIKAGDLLHRGMPHAADLLHRIILGHRDGNIRTQLGKAPILIEMDKFIPKNCVSIGSSPRFPMYDSNFGWGKPVGVRSGWANKFDGKMSAYPGREGDGSVDIEICLLPQTMSALDSDPDFLFSCSH